MRVATVEEVIAVAAIYNVDTAFAKDNVIASVAVQPFNARVGTTENGIIPLAAIDGVAAAAALNAVVASARINAVVSAAGINIIVAFAGNHSVIAAASLHDIVVRAFAWQNFVIRINAVAFRVTGKGRVDQVIGIIAFDDTIELGSRFEHQVIDSARPLENNDNLCNALLIEVHHLLAVVCRAHIHLLQQITTLVEQLDPCAFFNVENSQAGDISRFVEIKD